MRAQPNAVDSGRAAAFATALLGLAAVAVAALPAPGGGGTERRYATRAATETSSNWAGFAATSSTSTPVTFTSVTGTWKQPAATCTPGQPTSASAIWVGLGGYDLDSQALQQIGTDSDCSSAGTPTYYMWYELVPDPPVSVKLKIRPGDTITASVNANNGVIWMQLKNRTTGASFDKKVAVDNPDLSSAEWIVEAPSSCSSFSCRPVPLANFGSVTFSKVATIGSGHPGTLTDPTWTNTPIQLVPRTGFGFFPGSERGVIQTGSAAGTTLPQTTADGRGYSISWAANASASSSG
jgi:hypothetical protein